MSAAVRQECQVELHCRCNVCGSTWVVAKEIVYQWDVMCCWSTHVREVPGQLFFSDADGSWTRRPWVHGSRGWL